MHSPLLAAEADPLAGALPPLPDRGGQAIEHGGRLLPADAASVTLCP